MDKIMTVHDKDFNIIFASEEAKKLLNIDSLNDSDTKCYKYFHGLDDTPPVCAGMRCMLTNEPVTVKMFEPFLNKFLMIKAIPISDFNGQSIGIVHLVQTVNH